MSPTIISPYFKLERNKEIYFKNKAGMSMNMLGRAYGFSTQTISNIIRETRRYVDAGLIKEGA